MDFAAHIDFAAHNAEVKRVWENYRSGNPYRIPMRLNINPRIYLLNPRLNTEKITFQQVYEDPDTAIDIQMRSSHYIRHNLLADHEMGLPEAGWSCAPVSCSEEAWYGSDISYPTNNCPFCVPMLQDEDTKTSIFDMGIPDPFGGKAEKVLRDYDYMLSQVGKRFYKDVPLTSVGVPLAYTNGPMTVACDLRGTTEFCMDILADPEYAEQLLDFITDATIERIKAYRKRFFGFEKTPGFGFADDSIQLIGQDTYRDLVLPRHRRLIEELSTGEAPNSIHLCGDATRHFPMLKEELNIMSFDTGFPVNHGELLKTLGPDVEVAGGVHVAILRSGTPDEVRKETRRILEEVKPLSQKFIIEDANNLSPCTPEENIRAMYETVLEYGCY